VAVVLIEHLDGSVARWASAIGALRSDFQLVLWAHDRCWLQTLRPFPRALSGPGVRRVDPDAGIALAELLAAADLVLGERGSTAALAHAIGRRILLLQDDPSRVRAGVRSLIDPGVEATSSIPFIEDASHLAKALDEIRRAPAPDVVSEMNAVPRLVATLHSAQQWLLEDLPAGRSR
jgi:hypothetical protein